MKSKLILVLTLLLVPILETFAADDIIESDILYNERKDSCYQYFESSSLNSLGVKEKLEKIVDCRQKVDEKSRHCFER